MRGSNMGTGGEVVDLTLTTTPSQHEPCFGEGEERAAKRRRTTQHPPLVDLSDEGPSGTGGGGSNGGALLGLVALSAGGDASKLVHGAQERCTGAMQRAGPSSFLSSRQQTHWGDLRDDGDKDKDDSVPVATKPSARFRPRREPGSSGWQGGSGSGEALQQRPELTDLSGDSPRDSAQPTAFFSGQRPGLGSLPRPRKSGTPGRLEPGAGGSAALPVSWRRHTLAQASGAGSPSASQHAMPGRLCGGGDDAAAGGGGGGLASASLRPHRRLPPWGNHSDSPAAALGAAGKAAERRATGGGEQPGGSGGGSLPGAGGGGGGVADDAELARRLQEEDDARLARQVSASMQRQDEDARLSARVDELEALEEQHEAAMAAMAGHGVRSRARRAPRGGGAGAGGGLGAAAPAGVGPSSLAMFESMLAAQMGAPGGGFGGGGGGRGGGPGGPGGWGSMSLAALLFGGPGGGGGGGGGGQFGFGRGGGRGGRGGGGSHGSHGSMREMVAGAAASGIPPHLLFSDRDFTADDYEALCRLDDKVENRKGANQREIDSLPTAVARGPARRGGGGASGGDDDAPPSCSICLEDVAEGQMLRLLPCTHKFHKDCIDKWLKQRASCPVCNRACTG
ncbi:hypothetical protein FOA52_006675 [Chlamydomonas sp. UWO 241]|nr:hypothetical protein FOA52_006675 [Chlamydomonas sp. UWO 241]